MESEPSIGTDEAADSEPIWRIVTNRVTTSLTVLVVAFTLVGLVVAGTGTVAADEPADVSTPTVDDGAGDEEVNDDSDDSEESTEPATVTQADVDAADIVVSPEKTSVSVPVEADDGAVVTLRIRSAGDTSPSFIMTEDTTVEGGTANGSFNLSRTVHGDRATLTVHGNEALNESNTREVLVVNDAIGVEEDSGSRSVKTPGFGIIAGGLAVLLGALAARRRE